MITADDFRDVALSMQDAFEGAHMGHPDFRVNGRIFATLHTGDASGMVALTPEEQREFMWMKPEMFTPCAGAWGRQGATNVILAQADIKTLRAAMNLAWERTVAKPPVRKRAAKPVPKLTKLARPAKVAKAAKTTKAATTNAATAKAATAKAATAKAAKTAKTAKATKAAKLAKTANSATAAKTAAAHAQETVSFAGRSMNVR
jgi:hypothetical protein